MSAVCLQPLRLLWGSRDTNVLQIWMPLPPDIWWVGHTTTNTISLTKMLRCFSLRIKMIRCRRPLRDFSSCFQTISIHIPQRPAQIKCHHWPNSSVKRNKPSPSLPAPSFSYREILATETGSFLPSSLSDQRGHTREPIFNWMTDCGWYSGCLF